MAKARLWDVEVQWKTSISTRDGICLDGTVYSPCGQTEPAPCIVALTPYATDNLHDHATYFASRGLPFVVVDVRGRGNSQGQFRPYIHDARDGYDVVEWVASQPYCNGKVGMYGASYLGYVQWIVAGQRPQHLVTIVPVASPFLGVDVPMRNNIFIPYMLRWLSCVEGRAYQQRVFSDTAFWVSLYRRQYESGISFDEAMGARSSIYQEWLSHPTPDEYWDSLNPTDDQYACCDLPILTITGTFDGDQPGALEHYRRHMRLASADTRANHYLVIGPWNHAGCGTPKPEFDGIKVGPDSLVDMHELHYEWYAWLMEKGPKPPLLKKNVAYYVLGAERWRYASTLEDITERFVLLYLHSTANPIDVFRSGYLTSDLSGDDEPAEYRYDPRDVSGAVLESMIDESCLTEQRMIHASFGKCLVYHSLPFNEDTEISGFFKLALWIAIDQPDSDFRVRVYEINLHGGSLLLASDSLRARYRSGLREAHLIETRDPLRYDFTNFTFVSSRVRKGHRLRLVIDSNDSIHEQRNYNCGGAVAAESIQEAQAVTVRLFQDALRPSVLHVPLAFQDTEGHS